MKFLVFWALMGRSVISHEPLIEYRVVEHASTAGCLTALSTVKLNDRWNASCMTPKQFEDFRKKR